MDIWALWNKESGYDADETDPPYDGANGLYSLIDAIEHGDVSWQCFSVQYTGDLPDIDVEDLPLWMKTGHEVWFRDTKLVLEHQLEDKTFNGAIDHAPKRVFNKDGKRVYTDFMSGNWVWDQAVSRRISSCLILSIPFRMNYTDLIQSYMQEQLSVQLYSEATKQQSRLEPGTMSSTRYICRTGSFIITYAGLMSSRLRLSLS